MSGLSFTHYLPKLAMAVMLSVSLAACASNKNKTDLSAAGAAVPGSQQDFVVNVGDRVYFTVDSSALTQQSQATLMKQAQWLNQYPNYSVTVEGHADERGTREYNLGLSARRGDAVKNFLISQGVPAGRLRMIAYGKERPVAVCDEERCWNQNRRAVTVLGGAGS